MAASLHFLSLNPQTLSHHSAAAAAAAAAAPSSFAIFTLKPLPKSNRSLSASNCGVFNSNYATPTSKFLTKVAFSSDLDVDEDDYSGPGEGRLSPDLKLFVGNLPFNVDSAALAGLFQQAGNVEEVEVIYDRLSGRSRGFAFVTMSRIEEAEAAVQQFNGYEVQGRPLRVNSGPPPAKRDNSPFPENSSFRGAGGPRGRMSSGDSNKVYVGNLSWGVDDLALENLFSKKGNVKEARVVYDRESGRSKGFGFVTLSSPDEVNNAIESLDGADLDGRPIRVNAAESRDSRPRRQF